MTDSKIYEDIALRTGGDIYVGVVGPVRTGKSSFIKRFMETLVIPNIDNVYAKERARDELPQSGSGKTIMTAEPKFVPEDAVSIRVADGVAMSVRLIDCVGYMVNGAVGMLEDGEMRMVTTPWFDHEIDIRMAAEEGTKRVIMEHSTVGLVVTTDGSICGIPRADYIEAEQRVIMELKSIGKPFVILLNCVEPNSTESKMLASDLEAKYGVTCIRVNCLTMSDNDIEDIIRELLNEFPIEDFSVCFPQWLEAMPMENEIKAELFAEILQAASDIDKLKDAYLIKERLESLGLCSDVRISDVYLGKGSFTIRAELPRELYYRTLSNECGIQIDNDGDLISTLINLAMVKSEYDKVSEALNDVREKGYGVVMPSADDMVLKEPVIVRQGGKYCVVLRASAPAIHMIRTNVVNEVKPAVGGEHASEEILGLLLENFEGDTSKIWESNIFGKSLYDIAEEGLTAKLKRMPDSTANKIRNALQKIVNEGKSGLICIIV